MKRTSPQGRRGADLVVVAVLVEVQVQMVPAVDLVALALLLVLLPPFQIVVARPLVVRAGREATVLLAAPAAFLIDATALPVVLAAAPMLVLLLPVVALPLVVPVGALAQVGHSATGVAASDEPGLAC